MRQRFLIHLTFLGFVLILFSLISQADQPWESFISKEGKFSVLMPNPPTFQKVQHKSFVGTIEENTFRSKSNSESFNIEYSDISRTALFLTGPDTLFDETREGLLNNSHGIQLKFSPIIFQGNLGKLLMFKIPPQKNEVEMIGKAYFYLAGQRLYVLVGIAPRTAPTNNIDRFLSSFKLL